MKPKYLFIAAALSGALTQSSSLAQKTLLPPVAKIIPHTETTHGDTRTDNYFWLRDRKNPEVLDYLKAENAYTDAMMNHTKSLQKKLFDEMLARIKETDVSVPYKWKDYYYYERTEKGKEYIIYCRKKGSMPALPSGGDAPEEIMADENQLAKGYDFYSIGTMEVSPDQNVVAYGADTSGSRVETIFFKDLRTGKLLTDKIKNTTGLVWANDNKTVFYTQMDSTNRDYQMWRHELGTSMKDDALIYQENDATFEVGIEKTKTEDYIIIGSWSTLSTEMLFLDANNPKSEFKIFLPREKNHEYNIDQFGDKFYIITNWNAKNFRLMECDVHNTAKENWKEVIPHRADVQLLGMEVFKDYLVIQERENGLLKIRMRKWDGSDDHQLQFPEEDYTAYVSYNPEVNTTVLRYTYNSLATPYSVYDYDMKERKSTLLKRQEVLGGFNPDDYRCERIFAKAADGVIVPVSLVYKKTLFKKYGSNPLYLYGYGSYGSSEDPWFSISRLSLLDRGFVFAIAHIRGGEEMGRGWYEDGKLFHKKNTFTDFIACAEHLIAEKYTSKEKLVIHGASAGGLLMGAVLNMRPDLFKCAIVGVPYVDVINTMLDASIHLTTLEYDEWGNPNDSAYYFYMKSYSPYDNAGAKNYPAMLVTTSWNDYQVNYWEPAKYVAKLRAMKTDKSILLMKVNMSAGHGGASGRYGELEEIAFEDAFILDVLGIKE